MSIRATSFRAFILLICASLTSSAFSQIAAPEALEPVTVPARVLSSVEDRTSALDLLELARRNYRPATAGNPFTLKASFTATGQTEFEGDGKFQETVNGSRTRITAQFAGSTTVRLSSASRIYGNSATQTIPLRLQLVWATILHPLPPLASGDMLRSASVNYKGTPVVCILSSGWVSTEPATRFYQEREACVDPESHLLRVWSEKPGIYAEYDYTYAIDFHGTLMAREITISEAGRTTVVIHIDSLEAPTAAEEAAVNVTPDLVESFSVTAFSAFPLRVPAPKQTPPNKRVMVHATIGPADGKVLEAEALQNFDPELTQAALEGVKAQRFRPTGAQREAYINVMFDPTQQPHPEP